MSNSITDAWEISDTDFPEHGTTEDKLRFLLHYAVLAPSTYNTQPWRVLIRNDRVELYVDNGRVLRFTDPNRRELTISCGAFLFHLRLAMRRFGYSDRVELFPQLGDSGFLARLELGPPAAPSPQDLLLFEGIKRRHTNRLAFAARRVPDPIVAELQAAAGSQGAWLRTVDDDASRESLAQLIVLADRVMVADSRYRRELSEWIRTDVLDHPDGIPGEALGMPGLLSSDASGSKLLFDIGVFHAARDLQLSRGAPLLAILGADSDAPEDWLNTGQALDHVLLLASTVGIGASFLNAPLEVADLRPRVRETIDSEGVPQVILRLGYGPEPPVTPRRKPGEIIVRAPNTDTDAETSAP